MKGTDVVTACLGSICCCGGSQSLFREFNGDCVELGIFLLDSSHNASTYFGRGELLILNPERYFSGT